MVPSCVCRETVEAQSTFEFSCACTIINSAAIVMLLFQMIEICRRQLVNSIAQTFIGNYVHART